jgi:hypothetical protein
MKRILTVGVELPLDDIEQISIREHRSLLESDIILFRPSITDFYPYSPFGDDSYKGKPCFTDSESFSVQECCAHWRRELLDAVTHGKLVIILFPGLQDVYVATGEHSYSGTGRNARKSRTVTEFSNKQCLPFEAKITTTAGTKITVVNKQPLLKELWSSSSSLFTYNGYFEDKSLIPLLHAEGSIRVVGARINISNATGAMLILPDLSFDDPEFEETENGEDGKPQTVWSKKGIQAAHKLVDSIVGIARILKEQSSCTPKPSWVNSPNFTLAKEQQISDQLLSTMHAQMELEKKKSQLEKDLVQASVLKNLLYENGTPLETAILLALRLLGFEAASFENAESEFDAVFSSAEGRLLGEAEGKDSSAINVDKLRQLVTNIHEDFAREEVAEVAKGVLFGNAFRLSPPEKRGTTFTDKCLSLAKHEGVALITTSDLFLVAKYLSEVSDEAFATECRKAIFNTSGNCVVFPNVPSSSTQATQLEEAANS